MAALAQLTASQADIRLGLIGGNIKASRAPKLHEMCGRMNGLDVSYDLLIPKEIGGSFVEVFQACQAQGMRGLNITYPYKEEVVSLVRIHDPMIERIGSANTVIFENGEAIGYNTDYTGFCAAFRKQFPNKKPGRSLILGGGGVGKAIAFGLVTLGATEIAILDHDRSKAEGLARALRAIPSVHAHSLASLEEIDGPYDGIANGTPVGMVGYEGSPIPAKYLKHRAWAFDAVYTPEQTVFKTYAQKGDTPFLSGYELFFYQGVHAFEHFTGVKVHDEAALRNALRVLIS